jgi:hypothetical protein
VVRTRSVIVLSKLLERTFPTAEDGVTGANGRREASS